MNQYSVKNFQLGIADISRLLFPFLVIWLLGAIGLGWLVKSLLFLFGLLLIAPVVAFFGLRWWLKRNLVQAECPVCSYEFMSLKGSEFSCPSCGEPLQVDGTKFSRITPPGTIDVSVVEVSAQPPQLED